MIRTSIFCTISKRFYHFGAIISTMIFAVIERKHHPKWKKKKKKRRNKKWWLALVSLAFFFNYVFMAETKRCDFFFFYRIIFPLIRLQHVLSFGCKDLFFFFLFFPFDVISETFHFQDLLIKKFNQPLISIPWSSRIILKSHINALCQLINIIVLLH